MKKIIVLVMIMLFVVGCTPKVNEDTFTVGLLATLSGPAAVHGTHVVMGAEKAVEELNAKGANIRLVVEDNKNDPKESLNGYRKILLQKPDIIFTTMSGASKAIIPLAAESGRPVMTSLTYADFRDYDNVYQYFQTTEDLTALAVDFFIEQDVEKVALLSSNIEAGRALMDMAKEEFGMFDIVAEEYYPPGELDQRTQILKIVQNNPDAIYVFDLRPDQVVKQLKNNFKGLIVFTDTPVATNLYKLPEMDGVYSAAQEYMISGTAENEKFKKLFKDGNAEAGMGYDVIHLIWENYNEDWPLLNNDEFVGLSGEVDLVSSRKPSIPIKMVKIVKGELHVTD